MIDISLPLSSTTVVFDGDRRLDHRTLIDVDPPTTFRLTALGGWTTHTGTHLDAPRHIADDGETLDMMSLDRFHGPAVVIEVADAPEITPSHLPDGDLAGLNVLFKTRNSGFDTHTYRRDYTYVAPETAAELVRRRPNLVGTDYLSIDRHGDAAYPVHHILLSAGILILEGLRLADVEPGRYALHAHPLRIADADGSPVRALLDPPGADPATGR